MGLEVIQPDSVHDTKKFSYSQAVTLGNLVFVAGQVPLDAEGELVGRDDVQTQTEQVFKNLEAVLNAAGSGLDLVGKVTVFTTNIEYRPIIHEIRSRIFRDIGHYPASTLAVITSLAQPGWLVEIEAIALLR